MTSRSIAQFVNNFCLSALGWVILCPKPCFSPAAWLFSQRITLNHGIEFLNFNSQRFCPTSPTNQEENLKCQVPRPEGGNSWGHSQYPYLCQKSLPCFSFCLAQNLSHFSELLYPGMITRIFFLHATKLTWRDLKKIKSGNMIRR